MFGGMEMLSTEELRRMASVDIRAVDRGTLADMRDIEIDTRQPVRVKLEMLAEQSGGNVYIHNVADYVVKVSHQEDGPTLNEKMLEYVRRLSEIHI